MLHYQETESEALEKLSKGETAEEVFKWMARVDPSFVNMPYRVTDALEMPRLTKLVLDEVEGSRLSFFEADKIVLRFGDTSVYGLYNMSVDHLSIRPEEVGEGKVTVISAYSTISHLDVIRDVVPDITLDLECTKASIDKTKYATITGSRFSMCDLSLSVLESTQVLWSRMEGCNFYSSKFQDCAFQNCEFMNVDFVWTAFRGCTFEDCTFTMCNFLGTKWAGSDLGNTVFKDCEAMRPELEQHSIL